MKGEFNNLSTSNTATTFVASTSNTATSDETKATEVYKEETLTRYALARRVGKAWKIVTFTIGFIAVGGMTIFSFSNNFGGVPTVDNVSVKYEDSKIDFSVNVKTVLASNPMFFSAKDEGALQYVVKLEQTGAFSKTFDFAGAINKISWEISYVSNKETKKLASGSFDLAASSTYSN